MFIAGSSGDMPKAVAKAVDAVARERGWKGEGGGWLFR